MTRKEIAEYCGMAYSTLNDLVTGRTQEPRGLAAVKLYYLSEKNKPSEAA